MIATAALEDAGSPPDKIADDFATTCAAMHNGQFTGYSEACDREPHALAMLRVPRQGSRVRARRDRQGASSDVVAPKAAPAVPRVIANAKGFGMPPVCAHRSLAVFQTGPPPHCQSRANLGAAVLPWEAASSGSPLRPQEDSSVVHRIRLAINRKVERGQS